MNVAVIPARGGSRRIPRKNIRYFHGKPIIAYSIEAALKSKLFDGGVWVSTEDDEIGDIALKYGAAVMPRPRDLAECDGAIDVGTQAVTAHALKMLGKDTWLPFDLACCIYPTAPLMSGRDLQTGYTLASHIGTAYAYSVCGWRDAAQFYWGKVDAFLESVPLTHWSARRLNIDPARFCDINFPSDFTKAEQMYSMLHA